MNDEAMINKLRELAKPAEIKSLSDIRHVISRFMENVAPDDVELGAVLESFNESSGAKEFYKVSATSTGTSLRKLLMDGLEIIKKRKDAIEKLKATDAITNTAAVALFDIDNQKFAVDVLIRNKMGGERDGLRIKWKVDEGTFVFDPYTDKLFRVDEDDVNN